MNNQYFQNSNDAFKNSFEQSNKPQCTCMLKILRLSLWCMMQFLQEHISGCSERIFWSILPSALGAVFDDDGELCVSSCSVCISECFGTVYNEVCKFLGTILSRAREILNDFMRILTLFSVFSNHYIASNLKSTISLV